MQIEERIRQFVIDNFLFGNSEKELKSDQSFLSSGIIDSTGVLELVSFIEGSFKLEVKDEELIPENLDSIVKIKNYILAKTTGNGATA